MKRFKNKEEFINDFLIDNARFMSLFFTYKNKPYNFFVYDKDSFSISGIESTETDKESNLETTLLKCLKLFNNKEELLEFKLVDNIKFSDLILSKDFEIILME